MASKVPVPRLAATVLVLAPTDVVATTAARVEAHPNYDYSIFMVQRSLKSTFMPGAYVFPGGVIEDVDKDPYWATLCGRPPSLEFTMHITAVREVFEESGLLLASPRQPGRLTGLADWRSAVNADASRFLDMCRELDLVPAVDNMIPWSRWITPIAEKRRYDTFFFVAELDHAPEFGVHDDGETIDSQWIAPLAAVESYERGDIHLPPPTWLSLQELVTCPTLADVIAHGSTGRLVSPILPQFKMNPSGKGKAAVLLPGDAEHDDEPGNPTSRHRFIWDGGRPYALERSPDILNREGKITPDGPAAAASQINIRNVPRAKL